MIVTTFGSKLLAIIDPRNMAKMKGGKPMVIKAPTGTTVDEINVVFVPDMLAFIQALGLAEPGPGDGPVAHEPPTIAKLLAAFDLVKDLPEREI